MRPKERQIIGSKKRTSESTEARNLNRLTKLYPKPLEGEEIPITVLEVERKRIGWSPEEGKSVCIDEETDTDIDIDALKRVRAVNEVRIFNWLSGKEGLIELTDEEAESLKSLREQGSEAQLLYTRVRVKGRLKPQFSLDESERPRRGLLLEQL